MIRIQKKRERKIFEEKEKTVLSKSCIERHKEYRSTIHRTKEKTANEKREKTKKEMANRRGERRR